MALTCLNGKSRAKIWGSSPGSQIWFSGWVLRERGQEMEGGRHVQSAEGLLSAVKPLRQTEWAQPESVGIKPVSVLHARHSEREACRSVAQDEGSIFTISSAIPLYFIRYLWPSSENCIAPLWTITLKQYILKISFCLG